MASKYDELKKLPWEDIIDEVNGEAKMPLSVHIPLNWPASRKLVFCDCAMNSYILDVQGLNTSIPEDGIIRSLQRVLLFSWAFGEVPFVPDFRQTALKRVVDGLPVIQAEFSAWNIIYTCEYSIDTAGLLRLRMTVKNDDPKPQVAHLWLHPSHPLESKVFSYHYHSFEWDASKWQWDEDFDVCRGQFISHQGVIGKYLPKNFESEWVRNVDCTGQNPNARFRCGEPYIVTPRCQLGKMNHLLHLKKELQGGETQSCEFWFQTDSISCPKPVIEDYDKALQATIRRWKSFENDKTAVNLGNRKENNVFEAIMLNDLQLLVECGEHLRPCQGGSSERFYVWVWEAMCSLRPLLRLGFFKEVKHAIDFIFSLQDGGCPPSGKFTSTSGAIGTSGPKWANTTGAALILAADYLEYSQDQTFIAEYLDKMLRAGYWIIKEIRATRIEGNPNYGVMPEACASDGDFGQVIFTDCWLLGGLQRLRDVLKVLKHPQYEEVNRECLQYKHDLDAVMDRVASPDGFIPRTYGDDTHICNEFRFTDTCLDCCTSGVSSALEPRMARYLQWLEDNAFYGLFCSIVTPGIFYIGNNEHTAMKMYLEQGEWKKAWIAGRVFRRFAVTPDVYLTQERYSANDTGFTAWQPNASNNGRFMDMQLSRLWMETPDSLILYGGCNPYELEKRPGFENLHTRFGRTSLKIDNKHIIVTTELPVPPNVKLITPHAKEIIVNK